MKLIKVETHGFKSFAEKTTLTFDGGIVGIVGPNGSGKSNINDAIKWVLGEQSIKALRGDSMEDVIFSGSKTMQPLNKAEVTLTFDNSDQAISLPHKIFTISRVLERGKGTNQYFINGEVARYKDIKEIAMESGVSKSSLAIISQGTISNIAQSSPEERRGIFEEAAGTSKYKAKKIETLRKLEKTSQDLDKLKTIVDELQKQLTPLEKQALKAKTYLEKSSALKDVEVGLIVTDLKHSLDKQNNLKFEIDAALDTKNVLKNKIEQLELNIKDTTSQKHGLEMEQQKLQTKANQISDNIQKLLLANSKITQRREMLINGEIDSTPQEVIDALKEELESLNSKIVSLNKIIEHNSSDIENKKSLAISIENKISLLNIDIDTCNSKINTLKSKISILQEQKEQKSNLFKGTRTIVENQHLFKGLKGMVSDLLKIEPNYLLAIETILGKAMQNLVVDTPETSVQAVNFLKKNSAGRATFIPLSSIKAKNIFSEHEKLLKTQKGFVGLAADLVTTKAEYNILKQFLLGNILVTQDIETANTISKLMELRYMVVSLDGNIIRPGGVITGGQAQELQSSFGIDNEIKKLSNFLEPLNSKVQQLQNGKREYEIQKNNLFSLINETNNENQRQINILNQLEQKFIDAKVKYESYSQEKLELSSDQQDINLLSLEQQEKEKSQLNILVSSNKERISSLASQLKNFTIDKQEAEKSLRELDNKYSIAFNDANRINLFIDQAQKRLSEHYELTLERAEESYQLNMDIDQAREIVATLKEEIKQLGHVNIDSIEQYDKIKERYDFLFEQYKELEEAKNIFIDSINDIDKIIIEKIKQTVDLVDKEFNYVFQKMFGGGSAKIMYSDPSNILESGIDIMAQPPGKTIKNLKLFSGGEKALIAISLLFAIIKAKPIPLCILDEVEAALDEANVIRYAEFLQKLKPATQFIVITHRQGTMARVDHLFGATMQQRGATSFFSVDLNKAKELIEENE